MTLLMFGNTTADSKLLGVADKTTWEYGTLALTAGKTPVLKSVYKNGDNCGSVNRMTTVYMACDPTLSSSTYKIEQPEDPMCRCKCLNTESI
jgi:hypothetical protein